MEPDGKRRDLEKIALERFQQLALESALPTFHGQGSNNRIAQRGNSYFQFGDLRVDTLDRHIIIEVESAGGVTNLAKYWYGIESGAITKPVTLLHVFAQTSPDDYASHHLLWDFLAEKMEVALAGRFAATRYTYRSLNELDAIGEEFKLLLTS